MGRVGGFLFRSCRTISYDPAWLKPSISGCHFVVSWLHCSRPIYRHAGMPKARPLMCLTLRWCLLWVGFCIGGTNARALTCSQRLRTRLSQWSGWLSALPSSVRFSLRVDEVARGSYFDTFVGRGSQCKVCRGCAVSVTADESTSSGGSDGVSTSCATFATSIPTQG